MDGGGGTRCYARAVSSLAPAPSGAASEPPRQARVAPRLWLIESPDGLTAVTLAGALALLAFVTAGGTALAPNTWAEIGLLAVGTGTAVTVARRPPGPGRHGLGTLLAFAVLSALTALSIAWSIVPDQSWLEANRAIAYLAAFGTGVALVRALPGRWRGIVAGLGLFAVALSAWALLVKVLPGPLDPTTLFGRLRAPFDYWNATGAVAAIGLPPLLWAGARPQARRLTQAAAVPALAILLTALVLTSSRSALLAALCGVGLWFALVPLRLRGAALLGAGAVVGVVPTLWALGHSALTADRVALAARVHAGRDLGIVLVAALVLGTLAAWAAAPAAGRVALGAATRRRVGLGLICLLGLVPVAGLAAAAASSRGLTGEISHVWRGLTDPNGGAGDTPGRLVELGNTRALYWSEGLAVGEHHPLLGVGAGGFATARTRYTLNRGVVAHAHSYAIETFAELGLLGVLVSLGLLGIWARASWRTFGHGPDAPRLAPGERDGLLTLAAVVLTFGVHSSIDWTWEIPGIAVPALLAAAWLAARAPAGPHAPRASGGHPAVVPVVAGLLVLALLAAWAIWQPLRAVQAETSAQDDLIAGRGGGALSAARTAAARDPLSPDPLWTEADVLGALGRPAGSRRVLEQAVALEPQNPDTWRRLAAFDRAHGLRAAAALDTAHVHTLDRTDVIDTAPGGPA